jgi:hypothetical protein
MLLTVALVAGVLMPSACFGDFDSAHSYQVLWQNMLPAFLARSCVPVIKSSLALATDFWCSESDELA